MVLVLNLQICVFNLEYCRILETINITLAEMENNDLKEVRIEEQWCSKGGKGNNVEEGLGRREMMSEHRKG